MMSMQEMFYGEAETVWVVKPEKTDDNKKEEKKEEVPVPPTALELSFGRYYPIYHPPYTPPAAPKKPEAPKDTKVILKVPICCSECEDRVVTAVKNLKGIKSVECDIAHEKVTVVATTAATHDILLACRTAFKKSRFWTGD